MNFYPIFGENVKKEKKTAPEGTPARLVLPRGGSVVLYAPLLQMRGV